MSRGIDLVLLLRVVHSDERLLGPPIVIVDDLHILSARLCEGCRSALVPFVREEVMVELFQGYVSLFEIDEGRLHTNSRIPLK